MALKPRDLKLTDEEMRVATSLEVEIDSKLESLFRPGETEYMVNINTLPTERVIAEVRRRYLEDEGAWSSVRFGNYRFTFKV